MSQTSPETKGEYRLKYRASLSEYPEIHLDSEETFKVTIAGKVYDSDYSFHARPDWLDLLTDQVIKVGQSLIYDIGAISEGEENVSIELGEASIFATYDRQSQSIFISSQKYGVDQIGTWEITVSVAVDKSIFKETFNITIEA